MKPIFFLLLLGSCAYAQEWAPVAAPAAVATPEEEEATVIAPIPTDAPLASPSVKGRDLTIELVGNNIALVRDARRVALQSGANRLRLEGVPETRTTLGLSITPRVRVLRELGQRTPFKASAEKFELSRFIGQKITILRPVGNDEKAVAGTLLSLNPILLDTGQGVLLNPTGQWLLPGGVVPTQDASNATPHEVRAAPEWILGATVAGDYLTEYRYQLSGLSYTVLYTATLSGERVRLEGTVTVKNDLIGVSARDIADGSLLVANGTVRFAGPIDWSAGLNAFGFVSGEAPLQARFSFRRSTPFEQSFQNQLASRSVFIENTAGNGLGVFLPTGRLVLNRTVVQNGVPTTSLVSQTESWAGFAPGGAIDLPLGPSDSVKVSRTVTSRLLNPVTREWTVELSVQSDEQMALIEPLPANARLGETSPKATVSRAGTLEWTLPPSSDPIRVKYVVETPA